MDKKFCIVSLAIPLSIGVLLILILYLYDPFLLYHKPYFGETKFSTDVRMQANGVIKHYPFDSYIVGTSMLGNTSAKEAKEKLGGEWANLSLAGSTMGERAIILNYAFSKNPIHSVILSFDGIGGVGAKSDSFAFLYDEKEWDNLKVYFSGTFVKCALFLSNKSCGNTITDLEELASFRKDEKTNARLGGIQNWFKDYQNVAQLISLVDVIKKNHFAKLQRIDKVEIVDEKNILNKFLLSFIKDYPNTNFYIIVPPYSRLKYNIHRLSRNNQTNSEEFYTWSAILIWLVKELESYSNAKIYGFDTLEYADEIANYSDLIHYDVDMNSMQLDAIKEDTHRLTSDNIEEYLQIMEKKIQEYDIEPLVKIAKETLGEK